VQAEAHSVKALFSIPMLRNVCIFSGVIGFIGSSFNAAFVLAAYSPLDAGGLALSVRLPLSSQTCD
jgi:hypothetical protein